MSHKNSSSVPSKSWRPDEFLGQVFSNMHINSTKRIIKKHNIRLLISSSCKTDPLLWPPLKLTPFSPISVKSPDGRMSRSHAKAHASITLLYLASSIYLPNKMLSFSVRFWIQACWETKEIFPAVKTSPSYFAISPSIAESNEDFANNSNELLSFDLQI